MSSVALNASGCLQDHEIRAGLLGKGGVSASCSIALLHPETRGMAVSPREGVAAKPAM